MRYKKIDLNRPRCKECNELIPKSELKKLDKNDGICLWCINSKEWVRLQPMLHAAGWLMYGIDEDKYEI